MESIYFRSRFWDSSSVLKMSSNERFVYVYLITNEKTKPSGIYKFFIQDCVFRTGLKTKQVEGCLDKLREMKMIVIFKDWVFVARFLEETFNLNKKILSPKMKIAIAKQFKQEKIYIELIACFHAVYHTLSITYPYPVDTILDYRLETLDFRLEEKDMGDTPPNEEPKIEVLNDFDIFYQEYPNKKNRVEAEKAWKQVFENKKSEFYFKPINKELFDLIMFSIKEQVEEKRIIKTTKEFCPAWTHPATWLRARRWEDKPETKSESAIDRRIRKRMENEKRNV